MATEYMSADLHDWPLPTHNATPWPKPHFSPGLLPPGSWRLILSLNQLMTLSILLPIEAPHGRGLDPQLLLISLILTHWRPPCSSCTPGQLAPEDFAFCCLSSWNCFVPDSLMLYALASLKAWLTSHHLCGAPDLPSPHRPVTHSVLLSHFVATPITF